jgi:hypothetical protein
MNMKPIHSKMRALVLAGVSFALSCSSYPPDGAECPATVCSSHGACAWKATFPTCACDTGYDGVVCGQCAVGFHRLADGTCIEDATCAAGACGDEGVCSIVEGRRVCACSPATSGVNCADCRAGYHFEADAGCQLDTACTSATCANGGTCTADAGRVSCQCPDGTAGAFCEALTQSCAQTNPCSTHGACLDQGGLVRCACDPGYAGARCDQCYPGFVGTDGGTCTQAQVCLPSSCSFAGTCSVVAGFATCTCDAGYTGPSCSACAMGFRRDANFRCVANQSCSTGNPCVGPGTCVEQNGVVGCRCEPGFAGMGCESCYPGYHREGLADGGTTCALDVTCRPETCRFRGQCAADGGVATCACDPGFSGANCQTNTNDCLNSACGSGQCVDLINSNVCLCAGGTYGQVCP